ncbi:MAG TPA: J domain-containing protein [Acidimicrobiales bacterium]|nr:J domain-containing protein [Acidimicrobiales bacterium]
MTHYEVLGVARGASAADIRRAYVGLARQHHPDQHAGDPSAQARAEGEMRRINAAWDVLRDAERRRRYDSELDGRRATGSSAGGRSFVADEPTGSGWRPLDDDWTVDDPDDPRLDDAAYAAPRGGRALALVPAVLFGVGGGAFALGVVTGWRFAIAVGLVGLVLGVLLFVAAPVSVIFDSRRRDGI